MTCKITYRPPTKQDLCEVARNMRSVDVDEVLAGGYDGGRHALERSHRLSDWTAAAVHDGEAIAILGVGKGGSLISPVGVPWMLGTPGLYDIGRSILTEGRKVVHAMQQDYDSLVNFVWEGSDKSVRWLRKLGFTVYPAQELPSARGRFHKFEMRR